MRRGGVIAYPTDTVYGLGCDIMNKQAVERIRRMKRMAEGQLMSFVCPGLSDISRYGVVQDFAYRIMRRLVPGPVHLHSAGDPRSSQAGPHEAQDGWHPRPRSPRRAGVGARARDACRFHQRIARW
jgi:hypothetical protein